VTIVVRDLVDRFGSLEFEGTILVTRVDSFGLHARWHDLPTYKKRMIAEYMAKKVKERAER
jgi:hypothetical protein